MLLKSGEILENRYQILGRVGQGGFGTIYKAMHLGLKRPVAIKVVAARLTNDDEARARILVEAQALRDCVHPSTIKYLDFVDRDVRGRTFLVMEFIEGRGLDEVLRESGAFPVDRVSRLLRQIAGSLHEAHSRGLIHRDLKPENLMLVEVQGIDDFLKVIDFGLAKVQRRVQRQDVTMSGIRTLTEAGTFLGTAAYCAPEGVFGQGEIDGRYDIYSVAVILFELLCGEALFPMDDKQPAAQQTTIQLYHHVSVAPRTPSSVNPALPKSLDPVILKALEKEPHARYQTMLELADAFDQAIELGKNSHHAIVGGGQAYQPTERVAEMVDHLAPVTAAPQPSNPVVLYGYDLDGGKLPTAIQSATDQSSAMQAAPTQIGPVVIPQEAIPPANDRQRARTQPRQAKPGNGQSAIEQPTKPQPETAPKMTGPPAKASMPLRRNPAPEPEQHLETPTRNTELQEEHPARRTREGRQPKKRSTLWWVTVLSGLLFLGALIALILHAVR